jgi:hypothetical protein
MKFVNLSLEMRFYTEGLLLFKKSLFFCLMCYTEMKKARWVIKLGLLISNFHRNFYKL